MLKGIPQPLSALSFASEVERFASNFTGRQWLFDEIDTWLRQGNEQIFIIAGEPGLGKSAISAQLVCSRTDIKAVHFCSSSRNATIVPTSFVRSVASQLAVHVPGYSQALLRTIDPTRLTMEVNIHVDTVTSGQVIGAVIGNLSTSDAETELDALLRAPLAAMPEQSNAIVLVIDGLDEAATFHGTPSIPQMLATIQDFPSWLRIICTTRPEQRVLRYFRSAHRRDIDPRSDGNQSDLSDYIAARLDTLPIRTRLVAAGVNVDNFRGRVLGQAAGNFLYARALLDDIERGQHAVADLTRLPASLDGIYANFLIRFTHEEWVRMYQPLLGILSIAREPISEAQLAAFTGTQRTAVRQHLGVLQQLLHVSAGGSETVYSLFHTSLAEFLLSENRGGHFWCAPEDGHLSISRHYAGRRTEREQRVDGYGLRHWPFHLSRAGQGKELVAVLTDFSWCNEKLITLGIDALTADFDLGAEIQELDIWRTFLREQLHVLRRGKQEWPAERILLQAAVEHGESSPITRSADAWLREGGGDWIWLRRAVRPSTPETNPCLRVFEGHEDGPVNNGIYGAIELPGDRLVSWASDGTLRLWDLRSGQSLATMTGHTGGVLARLLPDGRLLSWAKDEALRIWNASSGECVGMLTGHRNDNRSVLVRSTGEIISCSKDGSVYRWDVDRGVPERILRIPGGKLHGAELVGEHGLVCYTDDGVMWLVDLKADRISEALADHDSMVWRVVVSDRGWIASCSFDQTICVRDSRTGILLHRLMGHEESVNGALELPGDRLLSWADDLRIWDIKAGTCTHVLKGHRSSVHGAILLEDGRILSWSDGNSLRIWDGTSGSLLVELDAPDQESGDLHVIGAALQLDKHRILSWYNDFIFIWDGGTGQMLDVLDGHRRCVTHVEPCSQGRFVSCSLDNTLRLWTAPAPSSQRPAPRAAARLGGSQPLSATAFACWDKDGAIELFSQSSEQPYCRFEGHRSPVKGIMPLTEGRLLSWSQDGTLLLWEPANSRCLATLSGHTAEVFGTLVLSEGRVVSWAEDNTLRIWDLESGDCVNVLSAHLTGMFSFWHHHIKGVRALSDGRLLSWSTDTTLRVWDPTKGVLCQTLSRHTEGVEGTLELAPGRLLSWSRDSTLRIWDLGTEASLLLAGHLSAIMGVELLPGGDLLSWSMDGTLRIWDTRSGACRVVLDHGGIDPELMASGVHPKGVQWATMFPDGRVLAQSIDNYFSLWDAKMHRKLASWELRPILDRCPGWLPHGGSGEHLRGEGFVAWNDRSCCGLAFAVGDRRLRSGIRIRM